MPFSAGSDFRFPGDEIEVEIQADLGRALSGKRILPKDIKHTQWGDIFIAYLPIHSMTDKSEVVGAIGIEFAATHQYRTYRFLRMLAPFVIFLTCVVSAVFSIIYFRRISNPHFQDLANTDYLTQLKNRNAYEVDIANMCAIGTAAGTAVVLADLNGLKKINDTAGHDAGDDYIRLMAKSLLAAASGGEVLYRVGGDEFIVLIKGATTTGVEEFIARLHKEFERKKCSLLPHSSFAVGYSICASNDVKAFDEAYSIADHKMYEDKNSFYAT